MRVLIGGGLVFCKMLRNSHNNTPQIQLLILFLSPHLSINRRRLSIILGSRNISSVHCHWEKAQTTTLTTTTIPTNKSRLLAFSSKDFATLFQDFGLFIVLGNDSYYRFVEERRRCRQKDT